MRKEISGKNYSKRNQWSIYFLHRDKRKHNQKIHGTKSHTKYGTMALPIGVTSSTACLGWESGTSEQARRRMQPKLLTSRAAIMEVQSYTQEMIQISINGIESLHYKFFNHKVTSAQNSRISTFILQFFICLFRIGLPSPKHISLHLCPL